MYLSNHMKNILMWSLNQNIVRFIIVFYNLEKVHANQHCPKSVAVLDQAFLFEDTLVELRQLASTTMAKGVGKPPKKPPKGAGKSKAPKK